MIFKCSDFTIKLEKKEYTIESEISMQILKQKNNLATVGNFCIFMNDRFKMKLGGWPAIGRSIIYLRGSDIEMNDRIATGYFSTIEERDRFLEDVLKLFQDYCNSKNIEYSIKRNKEFCESRKQKNQVREIIVNKKIDSIKATRWNHLEI